MAYAGRWLANMPKTLTLSRKGYSQEIAFDELRISDIQRYTKDFTPPTKEFTVDEHTRALFHFNGNMDGQSFGQTGALPASVK